MKAFDDSRVIIGLDDELVLESLVDTVRNWGFRAEGFSRPEAVLGNIHAAKCDIVLLDLFISGVCCLDRVQQFGADLKVIIMAESSKKDLAFRALKLGAFDMLEKPLEKELLYHSILRALTALENERKSRKLSDDLEKSRKELFASRKRLENMNTRLLDTNRALSAFAQNMGQEREEMQKGIALKLKHLIMPVMDMLRDGGARPEHEAQLEMLTMQIEDLICEFAMDFSIEMVLSSAEMRVASLVKDGVKTGEIARQLNIAEDTVRTHRRNIRRKLKIDNRQYSLRNVLISRIGGQSNMNRRGFAAWDRLHIVEPHASLPLEVSL
jgi:DNA-binding NarL/FixJ family response regulator